VTWKQDLRAVINNHWQVGQEFLLIDLYLFEDSLSLLHPNNRNIRAKIRQITQQLRRELILEFVDRQGTYRRRV
jgi:hypothetical protein